MSEGIPDRWVLDANVLYPTVLREVLTGCAAAGDFAPVWSPRIAEEWVRTADRLGGTMDADRARGDLVRLRTRFPGAEMQHDPGDEATLWLPDPADVHVLATAKAAGAAGIVTLNLRDFPRRELMSHGIVAVHPDAFLLNLLAAAPDRIAAVAAAVHAEAERLSGERLDQRALLKRARLPRFAKAVTR